MRRAAIRLAWGLAGTVVVLAVLVVLGARYLLDEKRLRDWLVATAQEQTGRTVRIGEGPEVSLWPTPRLTVTGVSVGNAEWGSRPEMLRVGRVTVRLDVSNLLAGSLPLDLEVSEPDVWLETDTEGLANWALEGAGDAGPTSAMVDVGSATVTGGRFALRDGAHEIAIAGRLDHAAFTPGAGITVEGIDASLTHGDLELSVAGRVGLPRKGQRGVTVELRVASEDLALTLAGDADPLASGRLRIDVTGKASGHESLARLVGTTLPPFERLEGRAVLAGDADGYRLEDVDVKVVTVDSELTAVGTVTALAPPLAYEGSVTATLPSARSLGQWMTLHPSIEGLAPLGPVSATGRIAGRGERLELRESTVVLGEGGLVLAASGTVARVGDPVEAELEVALEAKDLQAVAPVRGILPFPVPPVGSLSLAGRLGARGGTFDLTDARGTYREADMRVEVSGSVLQLPQPVLDLEVAISDLARLSDLEKLLGLETGTLPAVGPATASLRLRGSGKRYELSDLQVELGSSDVSGELILVDEGARPAITARLASRMIRLEELYEDDASAPKAPAPERQFSAVAIDLEWMRALDASIAYRADSIGWADLRIDRVLLDLRLRGGVAQWDITRDLSSGRLTTRGRIDAVAAPYEFALDIDLDEASIGTYAGLPAGVIEGGHTNGTMSLHSRGRSTDELIGALQGRATLELGPMRVLDTALSFVSTDLLSELVHTFNPLSAKKGDRKNGHTDYDCGVITFDVDEGVATSDRGIAFESKRFNVGGGGAVDLRSETIDFEFRTRPRSGVGTSIASLLGGFRVHGPLTQPKVAGSLKGAASEATKRAIATSAAATIGLGVLPWLAEGLLSRATAGQLSCARTLARVEKRRSKHAKRRGAVPHS